MDVFDVIKLICGLTFFLYGMHVMSSGLSKLSGGKLESSLKKLTSSPIRGLVLGMGITIAIQSSSAMTVMLVGLVNSGIMQLSQTMGVIMGSNIGTTLTAWILSLTSIESSNVLISLLKPKNFAPIIALYGIANIMVSKNQKKKDLGEILVAFSVLMYGMDFMSSAVSGLADAPEFASLLTAFENPILGVIVGAVFTGVIQSSAASVGILQSLSLTGGITYGMAIPIIMGQNIGTCVTALISSIGVSTNAKRVSVIHILFNLIGTTVCMILFYGLDAIFHFAITTQPINPFGISVCHSIFNIFTTFVLLPFGSKIVWVAEHVIKDKPNEDKRVAPLLDDRLLRSPALAVAECGNLLHKMADISVVSVRTALDAVTDYDAEKIAAVKEYEDQLDRFEDELGTTLVKLTGQPLNQSDARLVTRYLHMIGDFERLGDHALNIAYSAQELHDKQIQFSEFGYKDLAVIRSALKDVISNTVHSFVSNNPTLALKTEPLEQVIDGLVDESRARHIDRLASGECTILLGFIFSDILTNVRRISDHCSNIAVCVLQASEDDFDMHTYIQTMREKQSFSDTLSQLKEQYVLES